MINKKPIGTCPSCGESVFIEDDAVWTCPADLSESNPFREIPLTEITEEMRESAGVFSNCGEDFGMGCYERIPLHGRCYDKGDY